jgi:surface antigen
MGTRFASPVSMQASKLLIVTLGVSLAASACATKAGTGTAVGGTAGGALGYAIGGAPGLIIGGALGGLAGYGIGKSMDDEDRRRAAVALEQDKEMAWRNHHGDTYRIEPTQSRQIDGRQCRDFRMHADVDGKPDVISGTACRRADGSWEQLQG